MIYLLGSKCETFLVYVSCPKFHGSHLGRATHGAEGGGFQRDTSIYQRACLQSQSGGMKKGVPAELSVASWLARRPPTPLTNELICKIYDLLHEGLTGRAVAAELGISSATVSFVRKLRPIIPLPN